MSEPRAIKLRDAVQLRPAAERVGVVWPEGCVPQSHPAVGAATGLVGTVVNVGPIKHVWFDASGRSDGDLCVALVVWDLDAALVDDPSGMPQIDAWYLPVDALEVIDEE